MLKNFCKDNNPDLVFISEPMILLERVNPLYWNCLKLKLFLVNDRGGLFSNLWGLCKVDLDPIIISNSAQNISIALEVENAKIYVCAIYAHSNYLHRRNLWAELSFLRLANLGPWCYIGDFNVVLGAHECSGSHLPLRIACDYFQNFTNDEALTQILTRGAEFTWTNRRWGYVHTAKRLDRSICNGEWIDYWNQIFCCTLPRSGSDHHPLLCLFPISPSIGWSLPSSNATGIFSSHANPCAAEANHFQCTVMVQDLVASIYALVFIVMILRQVQ
ncbi:hypothetical protein Lal_00012798 [Lupinus albus]|nr:hypothetical protein Lal_00012798 [Lupinus albus]